LGQLTGTQLPLHWEAGTVRAADCGCNYASGQAGCSRVRRTIRFKDIIIEAPRTQSRLEFVI
jgi:hypothetical protein